jgi:hypothetical protein
MFKRKMFVSAVSLAVVFSLITSVVSANDVHSYYEQEVLNELDAHDLYGLDEILPAEETALPTVIDFGFDAFDGTDIFVISEAAELRSAYELLDELGEEGTSLIPDFELILEKEFTSVQEPGESAVSSRMMPRFNNNPNNAIFLDNSMMNMLLTNASTASESWYAFVAESGVKITVALDQPASGVYAIVLYRLVGNTLVPEGLSMYGTSNMRQQLSHITRSTDFYFLQVVPITPINGHYQFIVQISTTFDSAEVDDNVLDARTHSLPMTVNQTLDNPIDIDWFRFTTGDLDFLDVTLSNVPNGAVYSILIYDENLNMLGGFTSSGSETRLWQMPRNTTFFAKVSSVNGTFSATQSYRLSIHPFRLSIYDAEITSPLGNTVGIRGGNLYIDGVQVNMNNTFYNRSSQTMLGINSWISRQQSLIGVGGRATAQGFGSRGVFVGRELGNPDFREIRSNNAVVVRITDVQSTYSWFRTINGISSGSFFRSLNAPVDHASTHIVVDATTRRVIDLLEFNEIYRSYGVMPTMNGQPLLRF